MEFFRFFLGTPQRFAASFVGFFILAGVFIPGVADMIAARVMGAINTLFPPVMMLLFIYWVLKGIVGGVFGGRK